MATGEHDNFSSEATLERMLTVVGPLLRQRARVDAPDPAFVWALRARLLEPETPPTPTFVRAPHGRLVGLVMGLARGRGAGRDWRWRHVVAGVALAVAILALLAVAAVALVWLDLAVAALVAVALLVVIVGRHLR